MYFHFIIQECVYIIDVNIHWLYSQQKIMVGTNFRTHDKSLLCYPGLVLTFTVNRTKLELT